MPAYRQRIIICPRDHGQPISKLEFPVWWDRRTFFEKYGSRRIDTGNPFYVDYGLLLTGSEARIFDKQCKESYADALGSQAPHIEEAMGRLELLLNTASWVIVESYEWESGLD